MVTKSKQKQSQKQQQNVKVVINQNGQKKQKRKPKRQTRQAQQIQGQGPMPVGISSEHAMRRYLSSTPQINSNNASDLSNVINAIRSGLLAHPLRQPDNISKEI